MVKYTLKELIVAEDLKLIKTIVLCFQSLTTLVGLGSSLIVLVSMCFNTSTKRGELLVRILNAIGSGACDSLHCSSEEVVSIVKRLS